MPDDPIDQSAKPPDFRVEVVQKLATLTSTKALLQFRDQIADVAIYILSKVSEWGLRIGAKVGGTMALALAKGEDRSQAAFGELAAVAIEDLFGVKVEAAAMNDRGNRGRRQPAADAIGAALLKAFSGQAEGALAGGLQPSDGPAKAFLSSMAQMALEGWLEGWIVEACSLGQLETFGDLDDTMSHILGLGRASAAVHGPLVNTLIVTPLEWQTKKTYRPELLSPSEAIRQFLSGRWTGEQMREELARRGFSEDRIEALVHSSRRYFSAADVRLFQQRGHWTRERALQHLQDQGYAQEEAEDVLRLEGLRRIDQLEGQEAAAIVSSYVAREIDQPTFSALLGRYVAVETERALIEELAELRRGLVIKRLTPAEARRLAMTGILAVVDYRRALEADGYALDDIDALELDLRHELAGDRTLEQHKADQAAAREAERQAAADAKAAREAALAARNALPTLAEYRRAYVRGLLTRDALAQAITREKIAITGEDLGILLADADTDRAAHVAQLEARAAADLRKPDPALPLASLEGSVLRGILDLDQYARELSRRGFDANESSLATALLRDRLAQQDETQQQKAAAAEKAARGGIPLATFERAVRAGVRSLADYAAYLDQIQTPAVGKALILDLLGAQLAEDAAAVKARAARDAAAAEKGISLAQRRRAVVAGVRPRVYYEAALREAGWSTDDQRVDLALLDVEIGQAADARAKREALAAEKETARLAREAAAAEKAAKAGAPRPPPELSLSQLERAVKLGLLSPDAMRDALYTRGYSAEDVDLLVALVVAAIPDTRTAETRETAIAAELEARNISLADLQAGVLHGYRTLDDYAAELAARGYGDDDGLLLRTLLEDRVALEQDHLRTAIAARLANVEGAPPLEEILAAVESGALAGDQLPAVLERFGIDAITALLYGRLVLVFGA